MTPTKVNPRKRLRLSKPHSVDLLFLTVLSVTLVAFSAVDIRYLGVVFNNITRFGFLLALLLVVLARGHLGRGMSGPVGLAALLYLAWVGATTLWSQVPALTGPKAVLQAVVALTFMSAGYAWTRVAAPQHAFSIFAGMAGLLAVTGVLGAGIDGASFYTGSVTLFRGLAYNPNLLGLLAIMSLPWTLWFFHINRKRSAARRVAAYLALGGLLVLLTFTGARSSMLAAGITGVVYLYYAGLRRYAATLGLACLTGFILLVLFPDIFDVFFDVAAKGQEGGDIFYSRRGVWEESLLGAQQGGLFGLGYGVSAGYSEFSGGFSAAGYGREKGNTVLAVLEELGLIGLTLYALLIASFFARLIAAADRASSTSLRIQIGLVIGTALGLFANSQFEAWFVAPAAPGSPFFWSLLGCGMALAGLAEQGAQGERTRKRKRLIAGWAK